MAEAVAVCHEMGDLGGGGGGGQMDTRCAQQTCLARPGHPASAAVVSTARSVQIRPGLKVERLAGIPQGDADRCHHTRPLCVGWGDSRFSR